MKAFVIIATLTFLIFAPHLAWPQTPGYVMHQVTFPGSEETEVIAINDRPAAGGDVVGRYWYRPNHDEEILSPYFVRWGATYLPLTVDGCEGCRPTGLNRSRLIVGDQPSVGFEYLGATKEHRTKSLVDIQVPGAMFTWVTGVNDAGTVVGSHYTPPAPHTTPFMLKGNTYIDLPLVDGWEVFVADVNNKDHVVGTVYHPATGQTYGFLLTDGQYQFFAPPGHGWVSGLNDHGHIVGFFFVFEYADVHDVCCWRGFLFKHSTFTTINVTRDSQTRPVGITNAGFIAGTFWRPGDRWLSHGFRAVPKPKTPAKVATR